MPKIYTSIEKENIRKDLKRAAERSLFHKGVEGTTVDELVQLCAIPKGTFYLFYPCKEALYFDVLVSFRNEMSETMLSLLQELDENHIVTSLTEVFSLLTDAIYKRGIYKLYERREQLILSRKLEAGAVESEMKALYRLFEELLGYFTIDDEDDIQTFFESFMLIQYSLLYLEDIKNPGKAMRMLIRGLILQLVGE